MKEEQQPLLYVEHLKKYYPVQGGVIPHTTGQIHAVDDLTFSVREGETLGLVGESGCGKSTVGRQIVGLEQPTGGRIFYRGKALDERSPGELRQIRPEIQMIFQDPYSSLNPRKHIYEILARPMLYHGVSTKATVEEDMAKLLDLVGLPAQALGRYPHEFSGGQRQRIAIAKALSLRPRFLFCDEPVSALDVSIQAQILNLLKDLQKELHLTMLFVGHGLGAVRYVSDRIAVMYLGQIVEQGEAGELFSSPCHPYTQALLAAAPVPDPEKTQMGQTLLAGEVGDSLQPPSGCRFHPRCPFAKAECKAQVPELLPVPGAPGHEAACPVLLTKRGAQEGGRSCV